MRQLSHGFIAAAMTRLAIVRELFRNDAAICMLAHPDAPRSLKKPR